MKVLMGLDYDGNMRVAASTYTSLLCRWAEANNLKVWRIANRHGEWVKSSSAEAWMEIPCPPSYPITAQVL